MYEIGEILLRLGIISSLFGFLLSFTRRVRLIEALIFIVVLSVILSNVILLKGLLSSDFSLVYVINYTSKDLPLFYKFTAWWGGQAGSLMFWLFVLSIYTLFFTAKVRTPTVYTVIFATFLFFLITTTYAANPFERLPLSMPDGRGLNPLLQNVWMAIHPPLLYLGYIGTTFPAALSFESALKGFDSNSINKTRFWLILSWAFLTLGILLGGRWAYLELGWGGYWAWDPVENASFLPWIVLTAAIHTYHLVKMGSHRVWFFNLTFAGYFLSILGTFLTRSGVVESVHAFAFSDIGHYFIAYLSLWFIVWILANFKFIKLRQVRNYKIFTRGWYLSISNYLWIVMLFAVILGTFYPLITEIITGVQLTTSKDYYTYSTAPIFLAIILSSILALESRWDKAIFKINRLYFGISLVVSLILLVITRNVFIFIGVLVSLYGILTLFKLKSPAHIAHIGLLITSIGIVLTWNLGKGHEISFKPGETKDFYIFKLTHLGWDEYKGRNYEGVYAVMNVRIFDRNLGDIKPERRLYKPSNETTSEAGILPVFPLGDLYAVIQGAEDDGRFYYEVYFNPGIQLVWIGSVIIALAGIWSLLRRKDSQP